MPEGDTVWRTARRLDAALTGRRLIRSDLRWPTLAEADLTGRPVINVASAGKHLLIRLGALEADIETTITGGLHTTAAPRLTLHSHLRMDGSWHVHRTGESWTARRPEHGIRAVLANEEWTAIGHLLGMLDLLPTDREHTVVGHLGPDVLGEDWAPDEVLRRLLEQPHRPVGEALLDQRVLAGVGTLYMAESLFLRGITPWTPSGELADPDALINLIHRLLDTNRHRAVQSTTGDLRPGRNQWVHSRSGRPCRRCGSIVRVAQIGIPPNDRVAFYCRSCQSGPAPTDRGRAQRPLGSARSNGPQTGTRGR